MNGIFVNFSLVSEAILSSSQLQNQLIVSSKSIFLVITIQIVYLGESKSSKVALPKLNSVIVLL